MSESDAALVEMCADFRNGILDGRPSRLMCLAVSEPLAGFLAFYCGLHVKVIRRDEKRWNHAWIELPDGRVLDATADQFSTKRRPLPPVYIGKPIRGIHR